VQGRRVLFECMIGSRKLSWLDRTSRSLLFVLIASRKLPFSLSSVPYFEPRSGKDLGETLRDSLMGDLLGKCQSSERVNGRDTRQGSCLVCETLDIYMYCCLLKALSCYVCYLKDTRSLTHLEAIFVNKSCRHKVCPYCCTSCRAIGLRPNR
jgi:hypothetical protein